jgi:hypothetical protein
MYPKITLHANTGDITILKRALNDLLDRELDAGDVYGAANSIKDLLTQLEETI